MKRFNPMSDKFVTQKFHHIEFYTGDATITYKQFMFSLGFDYVAKSDLSTGNTLFASYVLQSGHARMVFTAPYGISTTNENSRITTASLPSVKPGFDANEAFQFFQRHGLGIKAIGITVQDVTASYETMVANGGIGKLQPIKLIDQNERGWSEIAEVELYGDVVLRLVNEGTFTGNYLPNYIDLQDTKTSKVGRFGIERFDHIVGNVWKLQPMVEKIMKMTVILLIQ